MTNHRNIDPKSNECPCCHTKFKIDSNGIVFCPKCGLKIDTPLVTIKRVNDEAFKITNNIINRVNNGRNKTYEMLAAKAMSILLRSPINNVTTPSDPSLPLHDFSLNNEVYEVASAFNYDQVGQASGDPKRSAENGFFIKNLDAKINKIKDIDTSIRTDLKNGFNVILVKMVDQPLMNDYSTSINSALNSLINNRINQNNLLKNVYIVSNNYPNNNEFVSHLDPLLSICGQQGDTNNIDINNFQIWKFDGKSIDTKPILSFKINEAFDDIKFLVKKHHAIDLN